MIMCITSRLSTVTPPTFTFDHKIFYNIKVVIEHQYTDVSTIHQIPIQYIAYLKNSDVSPALAVILFTLILKILFEKKSVRQKKFCVLLFSGLNAFTSYLLHLTYLTHLTTFNLDYIIVVTQEHPLNRNGCISFRYVFLLVSKFDEYLLQCGLTETVFFYGQLLAS